MTVAINARAAVRAEIGGVERVAREMAARLPAIAPGRYRVIGPRPALAHRAGHAWEQAWLPLEARGAELIYSPANLAPVASARNVVVIHDVAAIRHPEWYGRAYSAWQRTLLPAIARRARLVITVSEFSRAEIERTLGVAATVIPNGVDDRFRPAAPDGERPYVLAVGTRIARKNLEALTATAVALREHGIELVAAGSGRAYMRGESAPPVRALGYVPDGELPALYAGARALVMPSLYEGFGIPCLEAMASGTPVVASTHGALPETCGDAALLIDPADAQAFAAAAVEAAVDRPQRLIDAGLARAARFTWERAARATDQAIGRLLT